MLIKVAKQYMRHPETGQQLTPGQVYYLSKPVERKNESVPAERENDAENTAPEKEQENDAESKVVESETENVPAVARKAKGRGRKGADSNDDSAGSDQAEVRG